MPLSEPPMISKDELAQIRFENERYLTDRIVHLRRTSTTGTYGERVATFSTAGTYECGFAFSPFKFRSREVLLGDRSPTYLSEILVRARMPKSAQGEIDTDDRVVLTHKWGEKLDEPQIYDVQGYEELTLYGLILNLRRTGV
jgi:hypothetical protein